MEVYISPFKNIVSEAWWKEVQGMEEVEEAVVGMEEEVVRWSASTRVRG